MGNRLQAMRGQLAQALPFSQHQADQHLEPPVSIPGIDGGPVYVALDRSHEAYQPNGVGYTIFLLLTLVVLPIVDYFLDFAFLIFLLDFFGFRGGNFDYSDTVAVVLTLFAVLTLLAQAVDIWGSVWVFRQYMQESSYAVYEPPLTWSKAWTVMAGYVSFLNYQFLDLQYCTKMRAMRVLVTTIGCVPQLYATIYFTYYIVGKADLIPVLSLLSSLFNIASLYSFEFVWWVGRLCFGVADWHNHQVKFWIYATLLSVAMSAYLYNLFWFDYFPKNHKKHHLHPPPPPYSPISSTYTSS